MLLLHMGRSRRRPNQWNPLYNYDCHLQDFVYRSRQCFVYKGQTVQFLTDKARSYHIARQNDIFVFNWFRNVALLGNQLMPKFDKKGNSFMSP